MPMARDSDEGPPRCATGDCRRSRPFLLMETQSLNLIFSYQSTDRQNTLVRPRHHHLLQNGWFPNLCITYFEV